MSSGSLFHTLREAGQLLEVGMNDVNLLLPGSGHMSIGTRGLNGCTCVVILGEAIILAYVSPLPGNIQQLTRSTQNLTQLSSEHHQRFLQAVTNLVRQNARWFPTSTTAWGVFACNEEGGLQSVFTQFRSHLATMGYEIRPAFYRNIDSRLVRSPKGELVGLRRAGVSELYLEREKLWPNSSSTLASSARRTDDNDDDDGDEEEDDEEDEDDDE